MQLVGNEDVDDSFNWPTCTNSLILNSCSFNKLSFLLLVVSINRNNNVMISIDFNALVGLNTDVDQLGLHVSFITLPVNNNIYFYVNNQ